MAVHPCICGYIASSYSTMKRHRRICNAWASRDAIAVKIQNTSLTINQRYGSLDKSPYFKYVNAKKLSRITSKVQKIKKTFPIIGINYIETISKFGYQPEFLAPSSKKRVVAVCDFCKNNFETSRSCVGKKGSTACKRCDAIAAAYSRLRDSGNKHEFYIKRSIIPYSEKIDLLETKKLYGYSISTLSPFSEKKIVTKCDYCNKRIDIPIRKFSTKNGDICCSSRICIRQKTINTLQKRYGVLCTLDIPSVKINLTNPSTKQLVASVLTNRYHVDFQRQYPVGPYSFDFYIPSANLLIECQGDYFHDFKKNGYSGTPKDKAKASYIENNTNYHLVWIWEHELHIGRINKILDYQIRQIMEPKISFLLKDLEFKAISNMDAHQFLSMYHYLGNLGTVATAWGAFHDHMLVAVCVFGGVTRNQTIKKVNTFLGTGYGPSELRELRRLCIHPAAHVKNFASFSLKRFLELQHVKHPLMKAVVSFSDPNVGDIGTIYAASNWQSMANTGPSYHYLDSKNGHMIHKKTVWDLANDTHMTESDFAIQAGLSKVEEIGKKQWVKVI
jgi:very-short-patch-repair endonuclease